MAVGARQKKPKVRRGPSKRRSGPIVVAHDDELRLAAQAILATITRIKGAIADEPDAAERRRLRGLLRRALRKIRGYREALEEIALAVPRLVSRELVEQISTFLLVEDEFERQDVEARKRSN